MKVQTLLPNRFSNLWGNGSGPRKYWQEVSVSPWTLLLIHLRRSNHWDTQYCVLHSTVCTTHSTVYYTQYSLGSVFRFSVCSVAQVFFITVPGRVVPACGAVLLFYQDFNECLFYLPASDQLGLTAWKQHEIFKHRKKDRQESEICPLLILNDWINIHHEFCGTS